MIISIIPCFCLSKGKDICLHVSKAWHAAWNDGQTGVNSETRSFLNGVLRNVSSYQFNPRVYAEVDICLIMLLKRHREKY